MKICFTLPAFLICGTLSHTRAEAKERYVLRSRLIRVQAEPGNNYVLRSWDEWDVWLWDSRKKRIVWKERLGSGSHLEAGSVHWSKDKRALVIEDITRFMVWREGHRKKWYGSPDDYVMKFAWSPDNNRLLVMSDGSGAADIGCGGIYCFKLQNPPRYKYVRLDIGCEIGWRSSRIALIWQRYEDYGQPNFGKLKKPVAWRVP